MKYNNNKFMYLALNIISLYIREILLIIKVICKYIIKILCNYVLSNFSKKKKASFGKLLNKL